MTRYIFALSFLFLFTISNAQEKKRPRDYGIEIGVMTRGNLNAITDVPGVKVGHQTLVKGEFLQPSILEMALVNWRVSVRYKN